ncbi:MAG: hypothetical protein GY862_14850 [Gammaproteobacteria bacterium]|nr:hypothetical protein [Gammaproteobacteria bacterium]
MENTSSNDFAIKQFEVLRVEILAIKERVIRIQTIGIAGIPLIIGAGQKFDLSAILIVAPLIILVFAFMLVFEQGSLMRAGEYIKKNIETQFCSDRFIGWEHWLEDPDAKPSRRRSETFFALSAHIAFAIYYVIGTILALDALKQGVWSILLPDIHTVMLPTYITVGIVAFFVVIFSFRTSTR